MFVITENIMKRPVYSFTSSFIVFYLLRVHYLGKAFGPYRMYRIR
jgi:hypothetical protein